MIAPYTDYKESRWSLWVLSVISPLRGILGDVSTHARKVLAVADVMVMVSALPNESSLLSPSSPNLTRDRAFEQVDDGAELLGCAGQNGRSVRNGRAMARPIRDASRIRR